MTKTESEAILKWAGYERCDCADVNCPYWGKDGKQVTNPLDSLDVLIGILESKKLVLTLQCLPFREQKWEVFCDGLDQNLHNESLVQALQSALLQLAREEAK